MLNQQYRRALFSFSLGKWISLPLLVPYWISLWTLCMFLARAPFFFSFFFFSPVSLLVCYISVISVLMCWARSEKLVIRAD